MITESIVIHGLDVIFLSLTANEKWRAARSFPNVSGGEEWLTVMAVIALIIAVILLFWVFARYRRSEHCLNLKVTELTINNVKLRQENDKLTADNKKLQQENTELSRRKIEALENIINAGTPAK